jgi:hypothetical protein
MIFNTIFFGLYKFYLGTYNFKDIAESSAVTALSLLLSINATVLLKVIGLVDILGSDFFVGILIAVFGVLNYVNYLFFVKSNLYKELANKYENEEPQSRNLRRVVLIIYIILTIALLILV